MRIPSATSPAQETIKRICIATVQNWSGTPAADLHVELIESHSNCIFRVGPIDPKDKVVRWVAVCIQPLELIEDTKPK